MERLLYIGVSFFDYWMFRREFVPYDGISLVVFRAYNIDNFFALSENGAARR